MGVGLVITVLGLGLTGCGAARESGKPAATILRDAQAAAQAAGSVHIHGTVAHGGDTAQLDLLLTAAGDGRERITGAGPGQTIDVIKVGSTVYVQGLGGSGGYRRLSARDPQAAPLVGQLDMTTVFTQLIRSGDSPRISGAAPVAGTPAVQLVPAADAGVVSVADDAAHPYPLQVTSGPAPGASGASGTLQFTEWDTPTTITPPSDGGS